MKDNLVTQWIGWVYALSMGTVIFAQVTPGQSTLTNWQVVAIFLGTTICSVVAVTVPFYVISRSEKLIDIFARGKYIYLKFVTVLLVVWSASVLAVMGRMDSGPAAIFGMITGYVFGSTAHAEAKQELSTNKGVVEHVPKDDVQPPG